MERSLLSFERTMKSYFLRMAFGLAILRNRYTYRQQRMAMALLVVGICPTVAQAQMPLSLIHI